MRGPLDPEEASRFLIEGYGRMARAYDAAVVPYHSPIARRLLELGHVGAEERVLDIGCGTGVAAFEATATVEEGGSIVGIDLAEPAVRLATEKAAAMNLHQLRFDVMDSRALGLPADSVDLVVSCFGHPLVGRDRCFAEVSRVLRPRGRFVLATWDATKSPPLPFREMLEHRRPPILAPDVARLIEARKVVASTDEGRATQSGHGWVCLLRNAGFSAVQKVEEIYSAVFRTPDAFLEYSFAWDDNERELRRMTPEAQESFRREFRERVGGLMDEEGLVVDWPLRYFVVKK
jgi:ubiquinone/menaquinone biosynthesis C-methylase UbiE